jgi:hypothetical protein
MKSLLLSLLCACALALFAGLSGSLSATKADGSSSTSVTFTKDVAPIFFEKCASCHHTGDIAPMSLITYKEARPWARSIKEKVLAREMPPWPADPHYGEFSNDKRLSQKDIDTIANWVDQGAREGDPKDLPRAPEFYEGWHIGKPDAVLTMPKEYTLAAEGPDEYQYFKVPTNFKQDVWVQAAEARPGNRKIVHHIIAFVLPAAQPKGFLSIVKPTKEFIEKMKQNIIFYEDGTLNRVKMDVPVSDNGCATPEGGAGIFRDGTGKDDFANFLCGESPGRDIDVWPAGMAKKIPAGSTILLQIHYSRSSNTSGVAEKDRSSIGLVFTKQQPDKEVRTETIVNYHFQIPPGAESHEVTSCFTLNQDAHIVSLMPHMHLRGKDMTIRAYYPDGKSETLLNVPHYSFSWQATYYLKNPVAIPKGTRIECIAHFDNSSKNKYNPDPTKAVRFGDPTYDEMMIGFMDYIVDSQHLIQDTAGAASGRVSSGK